MAVRISIEDHPHHSETHALAKVTTARGYVYALTWAKPAPTTDEIAEVWRTERRAFRPYNESLGAYL